MVVNYDVPNTAELGNYIHCLNSFNHRSRSGRKGVAIKFATSDEVPFLRGIEHKCSTKIEALPSNGELFNLHPSNVDRTPYSHSDQVFLYIPLKLKV